MQALLGKLDAQNLLMTVQINIKRLVFVSAACLKHKKKNRFLNTRRSFYCRTKFKIKNIFFFYIFLVIDIDIQFTHNLIVLMSSQRKTSLPRNVMRYLVKLCSITDMLILKEMLVTSMISMTESVIIRQCSGISAATQPQRVRPLCSNTVLNQISNQPI